MQRTILTIGASAVLLLGACGSAPEKAATPAQPTASAAKAPEGTGPLYMTLQTDKGDIRCRLFEKEAPIAVERITSLAKKGYYDGITFHRVVPRFMVQTGDPTGTGRGGYDGPGYPFEDEFNRNLKFDVPGRLAMANLGMPKTNTSQFFVTEEPVPHLNNKHTIFGDCTGIAVVRQIGRVPTRQEKPLTPVILKKVIVERSAQ